MNLEAIQDRVYAERGRDLKLRDMEGFLRDDIRAGRKDAYSVMSWMFAMDDADARHMRVLQAVVSKDQAEVFRLMEKELNKSLELEANQRVD